uniref:Uncharacterized protein n=1 Tax=Myoviridae sp. ctuev19 TaxID=2827716 RepID=A0A8S5SF01_9CAUD|nr:MAG TPA: hypothetical protein [Myoviridae sp. ctuev19]
MPLVILHVLAAIKTKSPRNAGAIKIHSSIFNSSNAFCIKTL